MNLAQDGLAVGTFALRPDVVATVLDHGALLLDLDSKYFYLLNPSGWAVTQLFESGSSADLEGVRSTVDEMIRERLLQPTNGAAATVPTDGEPPAQWEPVKLERQAEPLQRVIVSAFDPSIPLAE